MDRAPRLVNTGDHVDLSSGYPGLRVAVTCEDDPDWLHERLLLWVIEPDRSVVLTPDGDMYEEMRDTWLTAQIMTGRRHFTIGPANVVAFADPLEDAKCVNTSLRETGLPNLSRSLLDLAPISTGEVN